MIELAVDEGILARRIESRIAETLARGEKLRADDDPEILKSRVAAYRAQTAPLSEHYRRKGMLRAVDGMQPIDTVAAAIERELLGEAACRACSQGTENAKEIGAASPRRDAGGSQAEEGRSRKPAQRPANPDAAEVDGS